MDGRFCVLQEVIFAIGKNGFCCWALIDCDFHEVTFKWNYNISIFYASTCN